MARIQNGHLTERGLARLTGLSQPHIHHILKGKRGITPQVADLFLEVLGMQAHQLLDGVPALTPSGAASGDGEPCVRLPLLEGLLGPEDPEPRAGEAPLYFPFPVSLLEAPGHGMVARLGRDTLLRDVVKENDLAVLAALQGVLGASPGRGTVYAIGGSWVMDLPYAPEPGEPAESRELQTRRRLLQAEGKPVAAVQWLIRGLWPPR